ncbi:MULTISPECIES: hypothetical protein [unclassified Brachybacterium]|uniref:hypothetical protein n=1 Tax=unclassified Brachybacterium TaxID=2623841 RepID=UPI0040345189
MRRPRRLVLSAAAVGLALAASGCSYLSPVQTHDFYEAADGTNANLEQSGALYAGMRNTLIVVGEDGSATFYGTAVNYSDETISIDLEGTADGTAVFSTSVSVPAHETVALGPDEGQQQVPLEEVPVKPGALIDLDVSVSGESTTITLPVLEGSVGHLSTSAQG